MKAKLANFIALDLGSNKIAAIAAYVDKRGDTNILAQKLHYSEGFKSGVITDLKAAESSLIGAIYALEKECEKNVKQATISLSGSGTKSYYIYHKIKISGAQISKQDIKKLLQKALGEFIIKDQEILHYFPIEFIIDDNNNVDDPVGMVGKELGCHLHIITVASVLMTNLTNCFDKIQIEITNVVLGIYASGLACLSDDEKNLGAIIIDLGAKTTSFGIFLSGKLIYSGCIPFGSWHITADIAKVFSVSLTAAEKLKVLYGNAMHTQFDRDIAINIDDIEPDNLYNSSSAITSKQIAEVIHARAEEILQAVKSEYDKSALDHLIARRLVITGGGSILRGMKELASKVFEKQVRVGKPNILPGFAEDYNPGIYSTAIGIVKNHASRVRKNSFDIDSATDDTSWLKKAGLWLKENI